MARKRKNRGKKRAGKNQSNTSRTEPNAQAKPKPKFQLETLEPRILLSATWVDVDVDVDDGPTDSAEGSEALLDEGGDILTASDSGDSLFGDEDAEGLIGSDSPDSGVDDAIVDGSADDASADSADDAGVTTTADAGADTASEDADLPSETATVDEDGNAAETVADETSADDTTAKAADTDAAPSGDSDADTEVSAGSEEGEVSEADDDADEADDGDDEEASAQEEEDTDAAATGLNADDASDAADKPLKIVLIDSTLDDTDVLRDAVEDGATIIEYDGDSESMTDVLARVEGLSESEGRQINSLSILSHGEGGEFQLGNDTVSSDMSADQAAAWNSLSDNFTEDANIYAYGCNVVDGSGEGQALLDSLSNLTNTEVFGSTDITGAGGDWELEAVSVGGEAELAQGIDTDIDAEEAALYESALADYDESGFSGTQTFTDGAISFTVSVQGKGTIDFEYDGGDDKLKITSADGTNNGTRITITDNNGGMDEIKFDTDLNGGTVNISGDTGDVRFKGDISGTTINVTGNIEDLKFDADVTNADVNVTGNVEDLKFDDDASGTTVDVTGNVEDVKIDGNVSNSTISVTGNVEDIEFKENASASGTTIDVTGNVEDVKIDGNVSNSTISISGDLDSIEGDGNLSSGTVTASGIVGQFEVNIDGEDYSNNFATPTEIGFDGADVVVTGGGNDAPTAQAGADQTVNEGDAVTLDATGSTDPEGQNLTYTWTQTGGPAVTLSDANASQPTFTAPEGVSNSAVTFEVSASDGTSASVDTVTINVNADNDAPTAQAGADQTVNEGDAVSLDATGSSDPEGQGLTYTWTQTGGPAVTLSDANASQPTFTAPEGVSNSAVTFEVSASDGTSASVDTVTINVNADNDAPTAQAGADQTVNEGDAVSLDATGSSDPEGQGLTYTWTQTGGPAVTLSDANASQPTFTAPEGVSNSAVTFEVSASDGTSASVDTVTINVNADNDAPTAQAGADQTVNEGDAVSLDATGSSDPEGQGLTYTWTQTGGPAVTLSDANASQPSFTAPEGVSNSAVTFEVSASDGTSASVDTVTINVNADNDAPTAQAGADQTVNEGDAVSLDATGSSDPEGQGLTYTWTQTGGPAVTLSDANASQPSFTAPEGVSNSAVTFEVSASDGTSASFDTVTINVNADDDAPTAQAGNDQSVDEGDTVTLDATGSSDPEGLGLTYTWTQTGGPVVTLNDANAAQPSFTAPEGTSNTELTFQVEANDGTSTSVDTVRVNVAVSPTNEPAAQAAKQPVPNSIADPEDAFEPPVVDGGTDESVASEPLTLEVPGDSVEGDLSGVLPDTGLPPAGNADDGSDTVVPQQGPSDSADTTPAIANDKPDNANVDPVSEPDGSKPDPITLRPGKHESDGEVPADAPIDAGADVAEDSGENAGDGAATGTSRTADGVDLFSAIAGPDYAQVSPHSSSGEDVAAYAAQFSGADINVIGGEVPGVPPELAAQGFHQVFQDARFESIHEVDRATLAEDPVPTLEPRGAAATPNPENVLADGPQTTDTEQQAMELSEATTEPSRRAGLFALMWGLVRGTGGSSKQTEEDNSPRERGQRSRRG